MNSDVHDEIPLPPSAARLLESMRDIGYSFQSALADIVDNSISASAQQINILNGLDGAGDPFVAIADNGLGMTAAELTAAMQHGAKSPREARGPQDLGRFGLGLKTASFSQCRRLTVVSRQGKDIAARRWDLDRILASDEWLLQILDPSFLTDLPGYNILGTTGTLVIWQGLDRLDSVGKSADALLTALNHLFSEGRRHLALTFHRFISPDAGQQRSAITIAINESPVPALDPFAQRMTPRADAHVPETIHVEGHIVHAQAFTLPHHQRITPVQLKDLSLGLSLAETQGLYIYRAQRLIAYGTWLGLTRRSEITRLLRVRVDVPTALDAEWGVDVRKSLIRPPAEIRERLKPLIERMSEQGARPYRHRGNVQTRNKEMDMWLRISERENVRYEINRANPLVRHLETQTSSPDFENLLTAIEATLPLESMFSDVASDPGRTQPSLDEDGLRGILSAYVNAVAPNTDTISEAICSSILQTHPFANDRRCRQILAGLRRII
ncbi:histidine kinase/DNA gyrase B/HSP90-like ATPase [Luteibacter rhizovicinus]|uniref:Histidine kinase/DNA gyrase B/HSP90-like ATPase n=1 Tax=Luteibacter rhizovicinus TaxID=242606 RepID=A0A4R3YHY3_9GAMM|nr:ATP-binding protein [Luteibacter rhizovicinus]TCV91622.1 histidine kinase/DNA gyrase B/HSP90-like ATPase [Luteibacter rhizovicinus]